MKTSAGQMNRKPKFAATWDSGTPAPKLKATRNEGARGPLALQAQSERCGGLETL
jgi:hypothetical protein